MTEEVKDQVMICPDCGRSFNWTARNQHVSASQSSAQPTLCSTCAQARKSKRTQESKYYPRTRGGNK